MAKHFLYLTNTRIVSLLTMRKRIVARREFAVSGAGAAEFMRYLADAPRTPLYLFTDLVEEDIRIDTLPHVGARDREAILGRKLTQLFRNTPYRYGQVQGREIEARRDDRVVYVAITNPEVLRPWLEAIDRLKVPLAGIYSSAVFSGALLEELDLVFPHALLVTFTPGEAMRQSYFRDREIKFSRLTPIDLEEGQSLGAMIAGESTRTWQYLDSLRHFAPDDRLEVCVLIHSRDREAIQPYLRDFAQIQYRILDIEQVALKLGLKPPPLGSSAEEVLAHLFLIHPAENHFASSEMRRYATLRKVRIVVNQVSLGLVAAAFVWGGWTFARIFQGSEADTRLGQELNTLNREYDAISRATPSFGVAGSVMRDAVAFYNGSIRYFPSVVDFLVPLSTVLQAHPQVELAQIVWNATDDPKAAPRLPISAQRQPPPVKAIAKVDTAAPIAVEEGASPPFAGGRYEVAMVEGTVRVPNNDFRTALAEVERLVSDIGRLPGYSAEVVESPLDVSSGRALQGQYAERDPTASMQPRFVLRIVQEHKRPA